jgi:hypothetical protein
LSKGCRGHCNSNCNTSFSGATDLLIAPNTGNVTPNIPIPKTPDAIINPVFVDKNPIKNNSKA